MIRHAIVAALVLSPLMIHAEDHSVKPAGVRVSTGVIAPKLIHTVSIKEDTVSVAKLAQGERDVVVAMVVDEKGKPSELKIVQSAGLATDQSVLSAVSQFRFQPGSVSGQTVAVPVNLEITIQK